MTNYFLLACGLIGNTLFAIAAVPTAYKTWKVGASVGTPISLAWTLFTACCTFYTYVLGTKGFDWLILSTAFFEITSWGTIIRYHYYPRGNRG